MAKRNLPAVFLLLFLTPALPAGAVHLWDATGLDGDLFGFAVSELEDQNGDGKWEILVGMPGDDGNGLDAGRVFLWFGGDQLALSPDFDFGGHNGEKFGWAVVRIGDVDDDGIGDFAVGAPLADDAGTDNGRVYVYRSRTGLGTQDEILEGPAMTGQFGYSLSAAGDLDGDGVDDLLVGAPYTDTFGLDVGAAYVFYGSSGGLAAGPDLTFPGLAGGHHFGWSVSDAGQFFADSRDCLVIGAPGQLSEPGAAYVFKGALGGNDTDTVADLVLANTSGVAAGSRFGTVVRGLGDWSGDGRDDLAVSAPNDDFAGDQAGLTEIFFGGTSPSPTAARYIRGEDGWDHLGSSLADVGDVTGGSDPDLLIGAAGQAADGLDSGRAYLYRGGSGSSYDDPASLPPEDILAAVGIAPGSLASDRYGCAVSAAGDFDGDGQLDLAVGADGGNNGHNVESGYVHLLDSSGTVTPTFLLTWSSAWTAGGTVLLEFSFSEPVDAVVRLTITREVFVAEDPASGPVVLFDGLPLPGGPLATRGETVIFEERPGPLPRGSVLAYTLELVMHDGRQVRLERLAGPAAPEPVLGLELLPAEPNPFNPYTSLKFRAPAGAETVCRVVDMRGWHVATLFSGAATGWWQEVRWDGIDDDRRSAPAGIYLVQVIAGDRSVSHRIVLAK